MLVLVQAWFHLPLEGSSSRGEKTSFVDYRGWLSEAIIRLHDGDGRDKGMYDDTMNVMGSCSG
jgi:hypothetical protein